MNPIQTACINALLAEASYIKGVVVGAPQTGGFEDRLVHGYHTASPLPAPVAPSWLTGSVHTNDYGTYASPSIFTRSMLRLSFGENGPVELSHICPTP